MTKILENITGFFANVDSKLLVAGALMLLIAGLIIYIITIIVFSLKERTELSKVRLPKIDGVGEDSITVPQFKSVLPLDVELIQDERGIKMGGDTKNDDVFLAALTMESGRYIPIEEDLTMPEIPEIVKDKGDASERSSRSEIN